MNAQVRPLTLDDIEAVAAIHTDAFPRQGHSAAWVTANVGGYPRLRYYIAETPTGVVGSILWSEKSGFRDDVVLELEQLAVHSDHRGQGFGRQLITDSLPLVEQELRARSARLKAVVVTTRADNEAQRLYRSALGAEPQAVIPELYSADEIIMLARAPFPVTAPSSPHSRKGA